MKQQIKTVLPTLRAPKGYHFKVERSGKYHTYIRLFDSTKMQVGYISLVKLNYNDTEKRWATHSYLRYDLHGKGLGALLYSKAIEWGLKHGYKIRSSGASSDMAQRVWKGKSLRQYFSIRHRANKIHSAGTWYAYPKKATCKKSAPKNKR